MEERLSAHGTRVLHVHEASHTERDQAAAEEAPAAPGTVSCEHGLPLLPSPFTARPASAPCPGPQPAGPHHIQGHSPNHAEAQAQHPGEDAGHGGGPGHDVVSAVRTQGPHRHGCRDMWHVGTPRWGWQEVKPGPLPCSRPPWVSTPWARCTQRPWQVDSISGS